MGEFTIIGLEEVHGSIRSMNSKGNDWNVDKLNSETINSYAWIDFTVTIRSS